MSIINSQPLIGASGNQGGYTIAKSLRLRSSASAYLSRTPGSTGDRQKWTWSGWVKRGTIGTGTYKQIFQAGSGTSRDSFFFDIDSPDTLMWFGDSGGYGALYGVRSAAVFRDPAAWYHIIWAADTTQATASNRLKLYVNGVQQTLSTAVGSGFLPQNTSMYVNNTTLHTISSNAGSSEYFDGYITDVNFIGGQQLTPSSFGETDSITGVWKPKAYSGTYGTNGFYLKFTDVATTSGSNAGLGKDFSGNSNYFNTTNISVTSGATYDSMDDVPTLTSATAANYAVLNPLNKDTTVTLSNGNLTQTSSAGGVARSSIFFPTTGKWYAEYICTVGSTISLKIENIAGKGIGYLNNGNKETNSGGASAYGASWTTNDVIGVAVDCDSSQVTFYKNNSSQGALNFSLDSLTSTDLFFLNYTANSSAIVNANFGQRPFSYTPPTGFKALNTYNLPDSTIVAGNKVMDATLYTGAGAPQTITNAGGFKPDLIWVKSRSTVHYNALMDSVRGTGTKALSSNTNGTESDLSIYANLTSFNSNGFTAGTTSSTNILADSGQTFVGWQWQAGQGSTSSNTSGSITSTVSVNASAGFSIVTWTGTGANATVGHGLGVAPKLFITKNRALGTTDWLVYHASLGATNYVRLNLTNASAASAIAFNNTAPTSSVFSVGTWDTANGSGNAMVTYCWSEIAGFSAFGSYTGNGSSDGPFIYTGFRPKFFLYKSTSYSPTDWNIIDTSRDSYNVAEKYLRPNSSNAEANDGALLDLLSNGFKIRRSFSDLNRSGETYIYAAFAENPFKNSLAR